jgi:ankyrin repeat protein
MRSALRNLATGSRAYDHAYKDAMERINSQIKGKEELAKQVLSWITCARRPLAIWEVQHALAVEIGKPQLDEENVSDVEDIISVCAGLVTVNKESNIIRLVHKTAEDYFERTQKCWFPEAETDIANTCVTYLSFDTFKSGLCPTDEEFEARLRKNTIYDYAARNWGDHARKAPLTSQVIMEFLESDSKVEASIQALMATKRYRSHVNYSQEVPRDITGSHLAAYFGLEEAIKELLIRGHKINLKDSDLRTPLSWAARSGHDAVIALFSAQNIFGIDSKDNSGQTALSHAAGNGHESAVKLLLTMDGVDPDSRDNFSRTPLSRAAMFGHAAVVELLLAQDGVDPDAEDDDSETPLALAAMYGHDAVVKQLLDTGRVVPESKDAKYDRTPLSWGAEKGNAAVVEKLLGIDGIDPDSKSAGYGNKNRTPLSYATEGGHQTVVELLMATDRVNLDSKDNDGRTPLSYAIAEAQTETIHSLLGYGASPTTIDIQLKGLLHHAIVNVNCTLDIVKKLLISGAPTNLVDIDNMTPLHYTVRFNRQDIAELLIQNGVPVDIAIHRKPWMAKNHEHGTIYEPCGRHEILSVDRHCTRGLTPLHYAALIGNCQMVQFFLDYGADPNAVSYYRETPLHLTLYKDVYGPTYDDDWTEDCWRAEVLLDLIDPEDDDAGEIYANITMQRIAVVDALLHHPKVDLKIQDNEGALALHRVPYGKPKCAVIVSMLIEKGAEVSAWNSKKQCPLHLACRCGDYESVQVLLSHGADILYVDQDGLNAFHYAATSRSAETLSRILEASDTNGLNISTSRDEAGRNALHHMLDHGASIEEVRLLLDKGVDVKDRDIDGNSPLASYLINSRFYIDDGICRLLLQSGSDALTVNDQGLALAHLSASCLKINLAVLEALMDAGVDIEILDMKGRSLLHHTALEGSLTETALAFLFDKTKLRSDDRDFSGKTPLQYAAEQARKKRHWSVFDSQRWSRSLEIFMRNEAVAG